MQRRNRPVIPQALDSFSPAHPVAHAIRTGSNWFSAWLGQKGTTYAALVRKTGMSPARFAAIEQGDRVSRPELNALAVAWAVSPNDLIASMLDPSIVIE